jgi:hypothetical protein
MVLMLAWPRAGSAAPSEAQIQQELQEVFERPEFNSDKDKELAINVGSPFANWFLIALLVAALALVLVFVARAILRVVYVSPGQNSLDESQARRRRLSASMREDADRHAGAGEYTSAVRCLFLSLVYAFDESGRTLFQPALTNREYLREFNDKPGLKEGLKFFVEILDANWYGQHPTTQDKYQECLGQYQRLKQQT